jgi:hypothetical protein
MSDFRKMCKDALRERREQAGTDWESQDRSNRAFVHEKFLETFGVKPDMVTADTAQKGDVILCVNWFKGSPIYVQFEYRNNGHVRGVFSLADIGECLEEECFETGLRR